MVKSKVLLIVSLTIFFILLVCFFLVNYKVLDYNSTMSNSDISNLLNISDSNLDFEIKESYCKKSNKYSTNPLKFYNEIAIAEVEFNKSNKEYELLFNSFSNCGENNELLNVLMADNNCKWIGKIGDKNIRWYQKVQQFEIKDIKSSVYLYLLVDKDNPNICYVILDQRNI